MRPIRLEMRGFTSFVEPTVIDFDDLNAFALVGPTGSGKSSIIDAICFALYGKVPRYGDRAATAGVISTGSNELAVRLRFSVGEQHYVVVRVVRRKGREAKPQTTDARLERVIPGGTDVLAGSVRDLDRCIDDVVGLSFEHFTRCVVLPQGEFARFLHDEPKDRRSLLVRLLDLGIYEAMRKRADELARVAKTHADLLDQQIAKLEGRAIDIDFYVARARELADFNERVAAALPRLAAIDTDEQAARQAQERAAGLIERLASTTVPDGVERLADELAAGRVLVGATAASAGEAERRWQSAVEQQSAGLAADRIRELIDRYARAERGMAVVAELAVAAHDAMARVAERSQAVARERTERDTALRAHAAHALARGLNVGEACPVCQQVINELPAAPEVPSVDRDALLATAERAEAEARAAAQTATTKHAAQRERLVALQDELALQPPLDALQASLAAAQAAAQLVEDRRTELTTARGNHEVAGRHVEGLTSAGERFADGFHRRRDAVAALVPPTPTGELAADWLRLAEWADATTATVRADARAAADAVRVAGSARASELSALDIAPNQSVDGVRQATLREQADIGHRVAQHGADQAELATVQTEANERRSVARVAAALALHLQSGRFVNWLVTESLETLAAAASARLYELSHGQFSLNYRGDEFVVVDHGAADEVRPARSLSGGETFQASLALALALADQVMHSRGGANRRLESIFLDEGFGTLDAECLDTVATAIDRLQDDGRLVGIVTHVPELAQRLPVRFRVSRGAGTAVVEREVG